MRGSDLKNLGLVRDSSQDANGAHYCDAVRAGRPQGGGGDHFQWEGEYAGGDVPPALRRRPDRVQSG